MLFEAAAVGISVFVLGDFDRLSHLIYGEHRYKMEKSNGILKSEAEDVTLLLQFCECVISGLCYNVWVLLEFFNIRMQFPRKEVKYE